MKQLLTLALLLCFTITRAQSMDKLRAMFEEAQFNEQKAEALYEAFSEKKELNPLLQAYKGASIALMAKFSSNPIKQMKYIRLAFVQLDSAALRDPENFEIRMLRFAIEVKTPEFIRENNNLADDSRVLTEHLLGNDAGPDDFHSRIAAKVVKYGPVDQATKQRLIIKYRLEDSSYGGKSRTG